MDQTRQQESYPGDAAIAEWREEAGVRYPILDVDEITDRGTVLFTFRCPWCGKKHYHEATEGQRVAHCDPQLAPPHGYILRRNQAVGAGSGDGASVIAESEE